jgi:3-deoxy-manno-octulosonate cytidylyltransferase (CMP-KDO synthetase)
MRKKIVCIIPARLRSTRFPKKMLISLDGKPLLQHVWDAATKTGLFNEIWIATDAQEIFDLVTSFGGNPVMTSVDCASGTDRLVELAQRGLSDADIWVNWQGDDPFIQTQMVQDLLQSCGSDLADVWTLRKKIEDPTEIANPHVAKVVCDIYGRALYFSRSTIPFVRDADMDGKVTYYKHVGIYAYTKQSLLKIGALPQAEMEQAEQLEQLRFLYNGLIVRAHETQLEAFGIDLPEHQTKAEQRLRAL